MVAGFWLTILIHAFLVSLTDTSFTQCGRHLWGETCSNQCHCARRLTRCRQSDGRCDMEGCSRGYKDSPICQTPCVQGTFGNDCASTCYCPGGDVCSPINGMCASGKCRQGYMSAGCQLKHPVFLSPPNVTQVSRHSMTVTWRPWSAMLDTGDGPVSRYHLQMRRDNTTWGTTDTVRVTSQLEPPLYTRVFANLVPKVGYSFRIALSRFANNKVGKPYPGPSTRRVIACTAPTEAPLVQLPKQIPQSTHFVTIHLHWLPPVQSTSGCRSIVKHVVVMQCDDKACSSLKTSVPMPQVAINLTNIPYGLTTYLTVIAVNDAGQLSPNVTIIVKGMQMPEEYGGDPVLPAVTTDPNERTIDAKQKGGFVSSESTEFSISLEWPAFQVPKYEVILRIKKSFSVPMLANTTQVKLTLARAQLTVHHLHAATNYLVIIKIPLRLLIYKHAVWTKPQQPQAPADPTILSVTEHKAEIYVNPLIIRTGPLTAYQIVMENLDLVVANALSASTHAKRSTGLPNRFSKLTNYTAAMEANLNFYLAAELNGSKVVRGFRFIIGDNRIYHGYTNMPLEKSTRYTVWIGIISTLDGITKSTYVNVEGAADGSTFTTLPLPRVHKPPNRWLTVGLPITLILLTVAILLILSALYYRQKGDMYWYSLYFRSCYPCQLCYGFWWERQPGKPWMKRYYDDTNNMGLNTTSVPSNTLCLLPQKHQRGIESGKQFLDNFYFNSKYLPDEFHALQVRTDASTSTATLVENLHLNRSLKVLPYDKNRLPLLKQKKEENDYINATLLKNPEGRSYIITQSPLPSTINHFWRVVWDYRIPRIVMLFDSEKESIDDKKCPRYWPAEGEAQMFGQLEVRLVQEDRLAYYMVRSFEMRHKRQNEIRYVRHFQYCRWVPARDIPGMKGDPISFLEFMHRCEKNAGPSDMCVVHCQTGGGRSGMFVAIDMMLQQARMYDHLDIQQCVTFLRHERMGLVSTLSQYCFIHSAVYCALCYPEAFLSRCTFTTHYDTLIYMVEGVKTYMQKEFEAMINLTQKQTEKGSRFQSPLKAELTTPSSLTPVKPMLPFIRVDSYRNKGYYIAIEHPTKLKAQNLWGLVHHFGCSCIVLFSDPDTSVYPFIPDCGQKCSYGNWIVYHEFTVNHSELLLERKLILTQTSSQKDDEIALLQLYWRDDRPIPKLSGMLEMWQLVSYITNLNHGNVMVVSSLEISRTGIFFGSAILLNKMEAEGEVNIFQTAQHIRNQFPEALSTMEQYCFCYRIIKDYLEKTDPDRAEALSPLGHSPYTSTPNLAVSRHEAAMTQRLQCGERHFSSKVLSRQVADCSTMISNGQMTPPGTRTGRNILNVITSTCESTMNSSELSKEEGNEDVDSRMGEESRSPNDISVKQHHVRQLFGDGSSSLGTSHGAQGPSKAAAGDVFASRLVAGSCGAGTLHDVRIDRKQAADSEVMGQEDAAGRLRARFPEDLLDAEPRRAHTVVGQGSGINRKRPAPTIKNFNSSNELKTREARRQKISRALPSVGGKH